MTEAIPIVIVDKISRSFNFGSSIIDALRDVSLQVIEAGSIVGLMGPSGSGKSTLLNLLGALDSPTSGSITIHGVNLASLPSSERADFRNRSIGFIFQNFNLIPVLTAVENVMLPAQLSRVSPNSEEVRERATELLNLVGLSAQLNQSINRLSGGQMQRVAIARALINKPKVILADELTANLDVKTAAVVVGILTDLARSQAVTLFIATHDGEVIKQCDRIVYLQDGAIVREEARRPLPSP